MGSNRKYTENGTRKYTRKNTKKNARKSTRKYNENNETFFNFIIYVMVSSVERVYARNFFFRFHYKYH
jgi:hypothetical protein